jgi:hypothetical protein
MKDTESQKYFLEFVSMILINYLTKLYGMSLQQ